MVFPLWIIAQHVRFKSWKIDSYISKQSAPAQLFQAQQEHHLS
jgi:hypothetical protein